MDAVGIDDTWLAGGCFDSETIGWTLNRKKEQMGGGISAEKAAHKMEQFRSTRLILWYAVFVFKPRSRSTKVLHNLGIPYVCFKGHAGLVSLLG